MHLHRNRLGNPIFLVVMSMTLAATLYGPAFADGYLRIKNRWHPDQYLHVQNGAPEVSPIQPGWWSAQWVAEPVTGTEFVRLQNRWKPTTYLHIERGSLEAGSIEPGWWSAQWTYERAESNFIRLRNRWQPNVYIHNQNGSIEAGPAQPGWWSAQWTLEATTATTANAQTPNAATPPATGPGRKCANESQFCFFGGGGEVSYGANGRWFKRTVLNGIACNNAAFGDPSPGYAKACFVVTVAPQEPAPTSGSSSAPRREPFEQWIGTAPFCAASPRDCSARGLTYVRSDKSGGGSSCATGKKVLCRGWRDVAGPNTKEVWVGTAPFCSAAASDCQRLGMAFVRSDASGNGRACTTGTKVLCRAPASAQIREWVGTAPFCNASANDCTRRGLTFIRSDKKGDGDRCTVGTKVLCEGSASNYRPQATGLTDSVNQVLSSIDIASLRSELERKANALIPTLQPKLEAASSHVKHLLDGNPNLLAQVRAAASNRDRSQVYTLLRLHELTDRLRYPSRRGALPDREPNRIRLAFNTTAPLRIAHAMAPRLDVEPVLLPVLAMRGAAPAAMRFPGERQYAQSADAFKTFYYSTPVASGAAGIGVAAFGELGYAFQYGAGHDRGKSMCRYGYSVPAIGFHTHMTIGEWTEDSPRGDYHGVAPGGYFVLGGQPGFWFDYDGNFRGWTLSLGAGFGGDGWYTRLALDPGCNRAS